MTRPTVTLRDGRQVSSWSEEWRHECEARAIVWIPTMAHRQRYLDRIERRRGTPARKVLEAEVRAIWDAERRPEIERRRRRG